MENLKNGRRANDHLADHIEEMGDSHLASSTETPMRADAFLLSDEEKISQIEHHFHQIMDIMGLDLTDDSLKGTPLRVAKMYVKEIFGGLNPANKPEVTKFKNQYQYRQMLVEKNIPLHSTCEHHFQPIIGQVHIAYIPNGSVIGLSKLNRIVEHFGRRPQVQERLTVQIANELKKVLGVKDVAVYIEATHMCVQARGVKHAGCTTTTADYSGKFLNENTREEFLRGVQ